jgi:hypothetical protein
MLIEFEVNFKRGKMEGHIEFKREVIGAQLKAINELCMMELRLLKSNVQIKYKICLVRATY